MKTKVPKSMEVPNELVHVQGKRDRKALRKLMRESLAPKKVK